MSDSNEDTTTSVETSTTNEQSKQEEVVKDTFLVGEEAKLNDNVLIVNEFNKTNGDTWNTPKSGHEYVIVNVTIKNDGEGTISYNPYDFKMQNSKGQITDICFTTIDTDTSLHSGELVSGGEVSGTLAFEQPINDEELVLIYSGNIFSSKEVKIKLS